MIRGTLGNLFFLCALTNISSAQAIRPSFPCEKARSLVEITICSDARLAELDRIWADSFGRNVAKDRREALRAQRRVLESRDACANDKVCLLDAMSYSPFGETMPGWIESYRGTLVQAVTRDDLSPRSYNSIGRRTSFALSSRGIQATLIQLDGTDTDHASGTGRTMPDDVSEYCERDPEAETTEHGGSLSLRQCVIQQARGLDRAPIHATANCPAKRLRLLDGTWQYLNYDGVITWKTPQGDVTQANASTAVADVQFELLCPNTFARLRADAATRQAAAAAPPPDPDLFLGFRCPSAITPDTPTDPATTDYVAWVNEKHGDWSLSKIMSIRMKHLQAGGCSGTLKEIEAGMPAELYGVWFPSHGPSTCTDETDAMEEISSVTLNALDLECRLAGRAYNRQTELHTVRLICASGGERYQVLDYWQLITVGADKVFVSRTSDSQAADVRVLCPKPAH